VVLDNTAENLSQMAVQVACNGALVVAGCVQLLFDFLQRFGTNAHLSLTPYLNLI
jgi:hypothetical protein